MPIDWNNIWGNAGTPTMTTTKDYDGGNNQTWSDSLGQLDIFQGTDGRSYTPLGMLGNNASTIQKMMQMHELDESSLAQDSTTGRWGITGLKNLDGGALSNPMQVAMILGTVAAPYLASLGFGGAMAGAGGAFGEAGASGGWGAANGFGTGALDLSNMTMNVGTGTGAGLLGGGASAAGSAGSAVTGGGMNFLDSIGFGSQGLDLTSGGLGTFGSVPTGSFGWESFMPGGNLTGMGAGAPTGTAGGSIWDTILRSGTSAVKNMFMPDEKKSEADMGKFLMSLASLITGNMHSNDISKLMQQQDPFGPQRPFYQDVLKQSYTDPNFLQNNPTFQAMLNPAIQETKARMAARGLNSSGNSLHELMRTGTETAAKFMLPFQAQTGQFAGSGIDPRTAGLLGLQSANASNQAMGNIGVALNEIWKTINKGPEIIYN